jgi:hypothetical protein
LSNGPISWELSEFRAVIPVSEQALLGDPSRIPKHLVSRDDELLLCFDDQQSQRDPGRVERALDYQASTSAYRGPMVPTAGAEDNSNNMRRINPVNGGDLAKAMRADKPVVNV